MGQSPSKEQQQCHDCAKERRDGPVLDPASSLQYEGPPVSTTIALGGGCFWGIEHYMTKNFQNRFPKSIKTHRVGFMNPNHDANEPTSKSITYQEVCQGKSGYVEVLLLELHDPQTHFEDVIRFFFGIHDPTTINLQGADRGTQYSSVIFCADECQKAIVRKVMEELEHFLSCSGGIIHCYERKVVQTKVVDLTPFTEATERHQEYLSKNPKGYCNHFVRSRDRRPPRTHRRFKLHMNMPTAFLPT